MIIVETDMFTFAYDGDDVRKAKREANNLRKKVLRECKKLNINHTYYLEEFYELDEARRQG